MVYTYWMHLPEDTDLTKQGYIGVSNSPKRRLHEHKSLPRGHVKQIAANKTLRARLVVDLVLKGSAKDCFSMERLLRPAMNIGWNTKSGGKNTTAGTKVSPRCLIYNDQARPYVSRNS